MQHNHLLKTLIKLELRRVLSENRNLLLCGGLGGHMMHLYDNPELTFGEMKDIFELASQGKLSEVTEKLDGQNMFFTFNVAQDELRFARNTSDIKTGGMDANAVQTKWADKPGVLAAFSHAYTTLSTAAKELSNDLLTDIFGPAGDVWYSAEILYTGNPNVINYDIDAIALHQSGTKYDASGKPVADSREGAAGFAKLVSVLGRLQQSAARTGWQLLGPVAVSLQKLASDAPLNKAVSELNSLMSAYGMSDNNTIMDYLVAYSKKHIPTMLGLDVPENVLDMLVATMLGLPTKPKSVVFYKSILSPSDYAKVAALVGTRTEFYKTAVEPLEAIVHEFAVAVLEGVQSVLALNPTKEVARLKDTVAAAVDQIKASGDESKMAILNAQLAKLQSIDRITSSMEGLTFKYKGKAYKLTGLFAPMNSLLGLLRYHR